MAASLALLCLGLSTARAQEPTIPPLPPGDPPITLPAPPSEDFFRNAQKPPTKDTLPPPKEAPAKEPAPKEPAKEPSAKEPSAKNPLQTPPGKDVPEIKVDKEQQKPKEADKDAPTLVFPRKERIGPGNINPLMPGRKGDEDIDFVVRTELPGLDRLIRRESEAKVIERIRQESDRPGAAKVYFPEETVVSRETYQGRNFPPLTSVVEPSYVYHGRLLFEQLNLDRHGWDMGVLHPVATVGAYYYDLAMMPYHICSRPFDKYEVSTGKCLPGDQVPFMLYPEPFSVTGLAGMAGSYATGWWLFR
jgi:hypothetical protein